MSEQREDSIVRASKFLSLVLRHRPDEIGLSLDAQGWAEIDELLVKAAHAGVALDAGLIGHIVETSDKRRFALSDDGRRIRANHGHSVEVDLGLEPQAPPEQLFHGTASRFLGGIRREGLIAGARRHVHLSADEQTAITVGQRYGRVVVLRVHAGDMHRLGHAFFRAQNGVWLTAHVPVTFLQFPDSATEPGST